MSINRDLGRPANRTVGWLALGGSALIASIVPAYLGSRLGGLIPITGMKSLGFILGATAGQYYFAALVPQFFVRTSQVMKFVATSPYTGLGFVGNKSPSIVFPEGTLTPSVPFLGREPRGNVPMELTTIKMAFAIPGKDAELFISAIYQYRVDPEQAAGYVGFSDETIESGITPLIEGEITKDLGGKTLEEAKKVRTRLNTKLTKLFGDPSNPKPTAFEETYCIVSERVVIQNITVSKKVQDARDAVAQVEQMMLAVATMLQKTPAELKVAIESDAITMEGLQNLYQIYLVKSGSGALNMQTLRLEGVAEPIAKLVTAMMQKGGN